MVPLASFGPGESGRYHPCNLALRTQRTAREIPRRCHRERFGGLRSAAGNHVVVVVLWTVLAAPVCTLPFVPSAHAQASCERNDEKRWKGERVSKADESLCEIERNRAAQRALGPDSTPHTRALEAALVESEQAVAREREARVRAEEDARATREALAQAQAELGSEKEARHSAEVALATIQGQIEAEQSTRQKSEGTSPGAETTTRHDSTASSEGAEWYACVFRADLGTCSAVTWARIPTAPGH